MHKTLHLPKFAAMKTFNVPNIYRSNLISAIKQERKQGDKMKKDFSPTRLQFGALTIYLARHFGFCYGVENAIEIAFRTVDENPGKRIFLLSEMIHNPQVNKDLEGKGVQFLMDTLGNPIVPLEDVTADDVVIIPAFGTTLELEATLKNKGIAVERYNTTCPFVEKVWNRSEQIAAKASSFMANPSTKKQEPRLAMQPPKPQVWW
jgi:4-hydroxy-3-methylbut-2-en-1-yl diphosphate reductase